MLERTFALVFELVCSTLAGLLSAALLGLELPVLMRAPCCVDSICVGFLTSVKVCKRDEHFPQKYLTTRETPKAAYENDTYYSLQNEHAQIRIEDQLVSSSYSRLSCVIRSHYVIKLLDRISQCLIEPRGGSTQHCRVNLIPHGT